MTYPAHTDLAGDTDLYIRQVAERADAKLAGQIRVVSRSPADGGLTVDAAGGLWVPFPGLTTLQGAILFAMQMIASGQIETMAPVPPASIGANIPGTYLQLNGDVDAGAHSGNQARMRCWTSPYVSATQPTNARFGAQYVRAGTVVRVAGLAWGT